MRPNVISNYVNVTQQHFDTTMLDCIVLGSFAYLSPCQLYLLIVQRVGIPSNETRRNPSREGIPAVGSNCNPSVRIIQHPLNLSINTSVIYVVSYLTP